MHEAPCARVFTYQQPFSYQQPLMAAGGCAPSSPPGGVCYERPRSYPRTGQAQANATTGPNMFLRRPIDIRSHSRSPRCLRLLSPISSYSEGSQPTHMLARQYRIFQFALHRATASQTSHNSCSSPHCCVFLQNSMHAPTDPILHPPDQIPSSLMLLLLGGGSGFPPFTLFSSAALLPPPPPGVTKKGHIATTDPDL